MQAHRGARHQFILLGMDAVLWNIQPCNVIWGFSFASFFDTVMILWLWNESLTDCDFIPVGKLYEKLIKIFCERMIFICPKHSLCFSLLKNLKQHWSKPEHEGLERWWCTMQTWNCTDKRERKCPKVQLNSIFMQFKSGQVLWIIRKTKHVQLYYVENLKSRWQDHW